MHAANVGTDSATSSVTLMPDDDTGNQSGVLTPNFDASMARDSGRRRLARPTLHLHLDNQATHQGSDANNCEPDNRPDDEPGDGQRHGADKLENRSDKAH